MSFVQTGSDVSARDLAYCTGSSKIQHQEDSMNNRNATSLLTLLDTPHDSHQLTLPQQLAQQTGTSDDANLSLAQQENTAGGNATDLLSADFLPATTNGDSFLDYLELFDEFEMFVLIIRR
jgi:hypothetical protein